MNAWDTLEELMTSWEKKHKQASYLRFIRDGIVDLEEWNRQETPKVCFFLKEAYTKQDEYNLVKNLQESSPWNMWRKVAVWTAAIHNTYLGERLLDLGVIRANEHNLIKKIAVVNVKKSNGNSQSNENDLEVFAKDDKQELKRQLELINPDVIICGYTLHFLKKVLGNELYLTNIEDKMYGFWKDKIIIDYYHPACHYPNKINYYTLSAIYSNAVTEMQQMQFNNEIKTEI